jgi:anaerobic magnesium-protoporphyrin IX monomethyl ester cyclase
MESIWINYRKNQYFQFMRILLVHPTFDPSDGKIWLHPDQLPPPFLGVNLLATILEQIGHEVVVLDELYKCYLDSTQGYATWSRRTQQIIEEKDIGILGITVLTHFRTLCFDIAKNAKKLRPDIKIILGGPHASFTYPQIFKVFPGIIDAVVVGEGEKALKDIADAIEHGNKDFTGAPNIATPKRQQVSVDNLQLSIDLNPSINYDRYVSTGFKKAMLITTRGCPHHECIFCSAKNFMPGYRERSTNSVIKDLISLHSYGIRHVEFQDEIFLLHHERIREIFAALDKSNIFFDSLYCHCRPMDLSPINLESIRNTGQNWQLFIGLESGSEELRHVLGKFQAAPVRNKIILENAKKASSMQIPIGVFLIFGTPGENLETIAETYRLLLEMMPADAFCSVLRIYPGTALYERAVKEGIIDENSWFDKPDTPFFFYPQGNDYYLARAAVDLFTEWFSSETLRVKSEQSIDSYLHVDTDEDISRIDDMKKIIQRHLRK